MTWHVADYSSLDNFPYMVCKEEGPAVAKVMFAADARLITAAPDLLGALRELVNAVGGCAEALSWARWQYDAGLAAIAKAEGAP